MTSRQSSGYQKPRSTDRSSKPRAPPRKHEETRPYNSTNTPRNSSNGALNPRHTVDNRSTVPRASNVRTTAEVTDSTRYNTSAPRSSQVAPVGSKGYDNEMWSSNNAGRVTDQPIVRSDNIDEPAVPSRGGPGPNSVEWDDPYNRAPPELQNRLTKEFMETTGALDFQLANDILAGTNWQLEAAIEAYKQIQTNEVPRKESTISTQSDVQPSASSLSQVSNSDSNSSIDKDRRLLRGLSKVYDMRDGADSMEKDKFNVLQARSNPNFNSKQLNINISLDNTYLLPDLSGIQQELADYIEQELIDFVTMNVLERTGHINWWAKHSLSRRLWPLHTTGDGNCLLHAASLGMWGVQDKHLQLRFRLHHFLETQTTSGPLYRRWRWQQTQSNKEMGLIFSEEEWQNEWDDLVSLSSATTKVIREDDQVLEYLEFLEEFHVYVLAQILNRPILVFADSVMRDVEGFPLSPVPFGGIYLPMECKAGDCFRSPLLLAYDRSHFTAVVTMAPSRSKKEHNPMSDLVPLTGPECDLLPMHFFVDPGPKVDWANLPEDRCTMMNVIKSVQDYMEVRNIPLDQIQAGPALSEGDLSKSGSASSLNGKDSKSNVLGKARNMLKRSNSKVTSKVKEVKNAPSNLELEPGNELIMCAKLRIIPPKAYAKDIEKYIELTRREYEDRKSRNKLKDPKTIPLIATKDYAKTLALQTDGERVVRSSAAISPSSSMCHRCEQFLGTAEQDNLCSTCYRESDSSRQQSDMCRHCRKFRGTKDKHYYCSQCYDQMLEGDTDGEKQTNNSNVAGSVSKELTGKYAISLPADDTKDAQTRQCLPEYNNNRDDSSEQHLAFPTSHSVSSSVAGNASLRAPYDRSSPAGHLQRSPPNSRETRSTNGLSLGMDPEPHALHIVSQTSRPPRSNDHFFNVYDEQRDVNIPIHHHPSDTRRTTVPRVCRKCNNQAMPADPATGLCRRCRSRVYPGQTLPPGYPVSNSVTFKEVKSHHLSRCKRVSCRNPAASNTGLCQPCTDNERKLHSSRVPTGSRYQNLY